MAGIKIFCPACGSSLKLPDRRFLGKKARCGKCSRAFIAYEPDPTDFPQGGAAPAGAARAGAGDEPEAEAELVGVAARWVPDAPAAQDQGAATAPPRASGVTVPQRENPVAGIAFPDDDDAPAIASRLRRKKGGPLTFAVTVLSLVAVAGVGWFLFRDKLTAPRSSVASKGSSGSRFGKIFGEKDPNVPSELDAIVSPTHGKPISLRYVPEGAQVLINLRPSALWTSGGRMEEFRMCCGPLATWLEAELKTLCLDDPSKIEEALIALIPTEKGQPPDVAAVVHLAKPVKRSLLLDRFKGRRQEENRRHKYYVDDRHIYMVFDDQTYAVGPRLKEKEFLLAADNETLPPPNLERLLQKTDRDRHFTLAFEPVAVSIDAPFLAPTNVQPLLQSALNWFGDDVEGVVWSLHLAPKLHSEVLLRNKSDKSPERLHKQFYKKLDGLPRDVLAAVEHLQPPTVGMRRVIGRFPAMTSAFAMSTRMEHDDRLVAFRTELPERAAPNLALGSRLTWDEIVRLKDAAKAGGQGSGTSSEPAKRGTIAERLAKRIDADFRNDPLYKALEIVGEMTDTKFKIEGNDLKMVGITQNMKQLFKMDNVPATAVLHRILDEIKLVIVVDDAKDLITVTSRKAAEEKRLKIFPLTPAGPAKP